MIMIVGIPRMFCLTLVYWIFSSNRKGSEKSTWWDLFISPSTGRFKPWNGPQFFFGLQVIL